MKRKHMKSLLRNADAAVDRKIAEQYPADWNMEHVFRQSMQKYQMQKQNAKSAEAEDRAADLRVTADPMRIIQFRLHTNRLVTAACLAVTFGIAGIVAYTQFTLQEPDILLDQTSHTVTVPISECEKDVTTAPANASNEKTESAENAGLQTTGAAAPAATAPTFETERADTAPSDSVQNDADGSEAVATEAAVPPDEPVLTATNKPLSELNPSTKPLSTETTPISTDTNEPDNHSQKDDHPSSMKQPDEKDSDSLFKVEEYNVSDTMQFTLLNFTYPENLPEPVSEYELHDLNYTMEQDSLAGNDLSAKYTVKSKNSGETYHFTRRSRYEASSFQFASQTYTLTAIKIGTYSGYMVINQNAAENDANSCEIYWFDGNALLVLRGSRNHSDEMIEISESLIPKS